MNKSVETARASFFKGLDCLEKKDFAKAESLFVDTLELAPRSIPALNNLTIALYEQKKITEASIAAKKTLEIDPRNIDAFLMLSACQKEQKKYEEALTTCEALIKIDPTNAQAHCNRGYALNRIRNFQDAIESFDRALAIQPEFSDALLNRGYSLRNLKRYDEALQGYDRVLGVQPNLEGAWLGRGNIFYDLKRYDEAFAAYDKALALKPDLAEAWLGRGNAFFELTRYDEALAAYDKALALKPDLETAWLGRGSVFYDLKRYDEALAAYDKALALSADLAEACLGRGNTFFELKRHDEALAAYEKALALNPDLENAWLSRGNLFYVRKRYDEAFTAYDKALALKPDFAQVWLGRGNIFFALKRYNEAFAAYDKAFALNPELVGAESSRLHAKMHLCDWSNFDAECNHLIASLRDGKSYAPPFPFLAILPSADDQLQCARLFSKRTYATAEKPIWQGKRYNHDRIRVAYLSADFGEHAVSILLAGLFEQHNRKRFETFAISFEDHSQSEMLARLKGSFDQFKSVKGQSDIEVARLLHAHEVDVAVDLMGHTQHSRTSIFALRPSPIQVNYLGYPGTMGADFIDYIIADRYVVPEAQQRFYSEKIVYLPDVFQANDSKRTIENSPAARSEVGLPENAFVFCSFNNSTKITPICFDVWMRLLRQIDGSVLWLLGGDNVLEHNLRKEAEQRGVNPARLIFASRIPYANYLARFRLADLFLDTFPFNAGTTASDALWAGLPIVTCSGEPFASRMAGSLLTSIGLPELIAGSQSEYETLAGKLARTPELMLLTKKKLAANLTGCPLFDTQLLTRHIEAAYVAMHERYHAGLPPDNIVCPH